MRRYQLQLRKGVSVGLVGLGGYADGSRLGARVGVADALITHN